MGRKIRYTEEVIIKQLQDHYKRNGKMLLSNFEEDKTVCSGHTILRKFESWADALEKAGLKEKTKKVYDKLMLEKQISELEEPKKRELIYTKTELIGKYRRIKRNKKYKNIEISMEEFCKEMLIDPKLIIENFRNWDNFCEISKPLSLKRINLRG